MVLIYIKRSSVLAVTPKLLSRFKNYVSPKYYIFNGILLEISQGLGYICRSFGSGDWRHEGELGEPLNYQIKNKFPQVPPISS